MTELLGVLGLVLVVLAIMAGLWWPDDNDD